MINPLIVQLQLIKMIKNNIKMYTEIDIRQVPYIVSYPPYYTENQLKYLQQLYYTSGLNKIELLPEYIANGLCYGYENDNNITLNNINQYVVIVDMGNSCTTSTVYRFSEHKMEILSTSFIKIGGRNIDRYLMDYIYGKVKEQYNDINELEKDITLYSKIKNAVVMCKEKLSADGADTVYNIYIYFIIFLDFFIC